jgi:ABC-2 type transport system permease protein
MNPVTAIPQPHAAGFALGAVMPFGRTLRAYAVEAKYESLRMLRAPAFAGPFLLLPAGLYLLFSVLLFGAETAKDPGAALFMFVGFSVFGVMGPGLFGFGVTIATEREHGLLRLKRALPVSPAAPLVAKMLMAMLFVVIIMATMIAAAPLGHVRLGATQLLAMSAANIFGALPFCALGFFVGSLASAKSAPAFSNLVYLPMIYLSGFLIPLPRSMMWIKLFSPAYHLHQIALSAIGAPTEGIAGIHIAVLFGVTSVFTALAVRRIARVG